MNAINGQTNELLCGN